MGTPTYVSSNVENATPTLIQVVLSEAVDASTDTTGWTVKVDGGADIISSLTINALEVEITVSAGIAYEDLATVAVAYAGGGDMVSTVGGTALTAFTSEVVTNNTEINPAYVSSNVQNDSPTTIQVIMSDPMASSTDTTGWTVKVDGGADIISSLITNGINVEITVSTAIEDTDTTTVAVAYAGSGDMVSSIDGSDITIFTSKAVTNGVYPDFAAADPTLLTGAYTSDGILSVTYDSGNVYTKIATSVLNTPSILRTALQRAGLYLSGDRRGTWSIIKSARDSIRASL